MCKVQTSKLWSMRARASNLISIHMETPSAVQHWASTIRYLGLWSRIFLRIRDFLIILCAVQDLILSEILVFSMLQLFMKMFNCTDTARKSHNLSKVMCELTHPTQQPSPKPKKESLTAVYLLPFRPFTHTSNLLCEIKRKHLEDPILEVYQYSLLWRNHNPDVVRTLNQFLLKMS